LIIAPKKPKSLLEFVLQKLFAAAGLLVVSTYPNLNLVNAFPYASFGMFSV
jgi:hypothetical protein